MKADGVHQCSKAEEKENVLVHQMAEPAARSAGNGATQETLETELESSIECLRQVLEIESCSLRWHPRKQGSMKESWLWDAVSSKPFCRLSIPHLNSIETRACLASVKPCHVYPPIYWINRSHVVFAAWHHPRIIQARK